MNILVTGGTGFVGTRTCRELADRGHTVTALSRTPSADSLPDSVSTYSGDVTDYDSIVDAFPGIEVVINLVSLTPLKKPRGGNKMHDAVHRAGTENVVAAAEDNEVRRIVQVSAIHADPSASTAYLRAKGRAEQLVENAECEWVILRPTTFYGEGGEFISFIKTVAPPYITPLPSGGQTSFQLLWIGDAARIIAEAADTDAHANHRYEIGGPDRFTLAEIAKLIHAADGRPSVVIPIPMPVAGVGMTLGGYLPGFPFSADQYRSLKLDLVTDQDDLGAFDVSHADLASFRAYLGLPTQ